MKTSKRRMVALVFSLALALLMALVVDTIGGRSALAALPQGTSLGTAFTYQGRLTDSSGNPITGTCNMRFTLYESATGNDQVGTPQTKTGVTLNNGYFTVDLDFGSSAFTGEGRYLKIEIDCDGGGYTTLSPRVNLTPAPYALYAVSTGALQGYEVSDSAPSAGDVLSWNGSSWTPTASSTGNAWSLTGNSGTTPGTNFLGTTDNQSLELHVNGNRALRIEPNTTSPNLIGGYSGNSVSAGAYGATIGGGGTSGATNRVTFNYGTIGGGYSNTAGGAVATVGGGYSNIASDNFATVGGGHINVASGNSATVSGGWSNRATITGTVIGGGYNNLITATYGTIAGGYNSVVKGQYATVGGGYSNTASGEDATVGGGYSNTASGEDATVGGGYSNTASGENATVGGGYSNTASGENATVGSGSSNTASGNYTTVGGGYNNTASGNYTTVGGGGYNTASGIAAIVGGGSSNTASGQNATVSGGWYNQATITSTVVGGGEHNAANGASATVSGGEGNQAVGSAATVSGGSGNVAGDTFATVPGGAGAIASLYGQMAYASGPFAQPSDAQTSLYVMRGTTNDSNWHSLYLDGSSRLLILPPTRTFTFDILIVGRSDTAGNDESAGYHCQGVIENVGGNTTLIGSGSVCTTLGEDDANWSVWVIADNTNDALVVLVAGNGENIRWVASVRTAEVSW